MAKKQEPKTPKAPLTVRQAIQAPANLAKSGGKLALGVGAGMAAEQLLQSTFPGLVSWAQKANINIGPVNVSAYDPMGALAFETGIQGVQALRGAKVTPGSLAAGAGGYLVGSKIGQGLARSLGAEEGGFAEMGAEMAGGLAGQMGVDRVFGGGAQATQAATQATQAATQTGRAGQVAQTTKTVGQRLKNFGKGFSAASRAGVRPSNLLSVNPSATALEKGMKSAMALSPSREADIRILRQGQKLSPFAKGGGIAGRVSGGLGVLGTAFSEYGKGTQYQGLGAEAGNVALTTGLGVATPAALAGLGTLATGGGAASAGVAAGAAAAAALPLAVAAGGLATGAAIGRGALTNLAGRENARIDFENAMAIYQNNKSQMTKNQRIAEEERLAQMAKSIGETEQLGRAKLSDAYMGTVGKAVGYLPFVGNAAMTREELKQAISAESEKGMKDVKVARDASGKVTGIKSDVADEMRRRAEEKARETVGMSAREKDEAQKQQIAFMKSQAEKNVQFRQPEIKKVEAEEEEARTQSARDAVAQAIAAGYEPDPELLKQAGVAGQEPAPAPAPVSKREAFNQKLEAEKKMSFDEWRKRFG